MKTHTLGRLGAVVVVTAAVLATAASAQLPVALDAQVVPIAPEVSEATYPTYDVNRSRVREGTTTWRVVEGTGNCCENYVTTSSDGTLYDFGGTYINITTDRGLTWTSVRPILPDVNGEGTIVLAPGGDVIGVGWDPYSGDHLQAFKYEADTGKWQYTETPIHQPFYDREWVAVVPGPITIDGGTHEYIVFLKGGWPSKELWYYSTDGLNYTQVSSKIVDKTVNGASRSLVTGVRADADWLQGNTNSGMFPLGGPSLLAAPDYPSSQWSLYDGGASEWTRVTLADGSSPSGLFQVDSAGRLHNVIPQGTKFTYRWTTDNGATWASTEVALPTSMVIEEIDFRANRAAAVAAVVIRAQDTTYGSDQDLVYKFGIGPRDTAPSLQRWYEVGLGDRNSTAGLGNDVRMDFQTIAVFPDGRVAVSFLDSTTTSRSPTTGNERPSPALAIEQKTRIRAPWPGEPEWPVGQAQAPISALVPVLLSGAGEARVAPATSTYYEFSTPADADNASMVAMGWFTAPGDIDFYLQRQLDDGTWSGDLASGTSSSLADEVLDVGRMLPGSNYRLELHNWLGPPNLVELELTFFNSDGVSGT